MSAMFLGCDFIMPVNKIYARPLMVKSGDRLLLVNQNRAFGVYYLKASFQNKLLPKRNAML